MTGLRPPDQSGIGLSGGHLEGGEPRAQLGDLALELHPAAPLLHEVGGERAQGEAEPLPPFLRRAVASP
jgi:hypothetical protein